ncbi:hypothetical protein QTP86_015857 [Hemibagrus guttatus]|nr:hypothetical protein QTP86_015857 [Hemibagrus guttatus]
MDQRHLTSKLSSLLALHLAYSDPLALLDWYHHLSGKKFLVTYRPSSKNCKTDALSRQFEASSEPVQPDLILLVTAILAPVRWSLMEEI